MRAGAVCTGVTLEGAEGEARNSGGTSRTAKQHFQVFQKIKQFSNPRVQPIARNDENFLALDTHSGSLAQHPGRFENESSRLSGIRNLRLRHLRLSLQNRRQLASLQLLAGNLINLVAKPRQPLPTRKRELRNPQNPSQL